MISTQMNEVNFQAWQVAQRDRATHHALLDIRMYFGKPVTVDGLKLQVNVLALGFEDVLLTVLLPDALLGVGDESLRGLLR